MVLFIIDIDLLSDSIEVFCQGRMDGQ